MTQLSYSMFQDILLPKDDGGASGEGYQLTLEKILRYAPAMNIALAEAALVVFDFETTGLDTYNDHIIEIGGLKTQRGKIVAEYSTLVSPPIPITENITQITGITEQMLEGQPKIEKVLGEFLEFIDGCILVAHNADFDLAFLKRACERQGIQLDWPVFCTLKMARKLLPDLESRNLDTLAEHFGLTFESRHRSIGDCKVTSSVLQSLLNQGGDDLKYWESVQAFASN